MDQRQVITEEISRRAKDLPRERRDSFLSQTCGSDPELRRAVEARLAEEEVAGDVRSDDTRQARTLPHVDGLKPGRLIAGRYRIAGLLGTGGMGVVYRARDEKLERDVAIKMLQGMPATGNQEARERFRREARALARLNHAHIAAVYDALEDDGADLIVMELVTGESLAATMNSGSFSIEQATSIVLQIAAALEEAHTQGVIHRDLKPGNVLVNPRGQVKVLDFGLAKLLAVADQTQSLVETGTVMGTPLYMSPEQALGKPVDARTDIWSLGVVYYELLTGQPPFRGGSALAILQAITQDNLTPARELRPQLPPEADAITDRALAKEVSGRYASAREMAQDLSALLEKVSGTAAARGREAARRSWIKGLTVGGAVVLLAAVAMGVIGYRRIVERRWVREEAAPEMERLLDQRHPAAAYVVLERAEKILPGDAQLAKYASENTLTASVESDPEGASVEIQDYLVPQGPWLPLGTTPLRGMRLPKGYFRWKLTRGGQMLLAAPETTATMKFPLAKEAESPQGMVYVPANTWASYDAFIGWIGPYKLPAFYADRDEVTNAEYQKFVDAGGYTRTDLWKEPFTKDGRTVPWADAMAAFRDTTGRPGPANWEGGHYPDGQGNFPVNGVSWYEAAAYAAWAGKSLPVLSQWDELADPDATDYIAQVSNIGRTSVAAVGTFPGVGPYGTYDTAGNVREWIANSTEDGLHFILGGAWKETPYLSTDPEALTPWDRSEGNGIRCVRNLGSIPDAAAAPVRRVSRDFAHYKPVSDEVFHAYELLYAYAKTPLNAKVEGVVGETADWREEKVTFDAAYNGERMAGYLFLPKRVQPPYQTVLFFPSARVMFQPPDSSHLGDTQFFDYIVASGRAVMYPVYQDTYERRLTFKLPGGGQRIGLTTEWYKDAARSLDYLETRKDIDSGKFAYLGVSMGSADGAIVATLLEDRLKTAIFLDGGYFLGTPPPGGDQADFVPRMKKPMLMVNGRYDYTFPLETAQNPMFAMLGTPAGEKEHVVLDTPHDVTEQRPALVKVVLDWLDKYLGRVDAQGQ